MKEKGRSRTAARINTFRFLFVVVAFETVLGQVSWKKTAQRLQNVSICICILLPFIPREVCAGDTAADKLRLGQLVTSKAIKVRMEKMQDKFQTYIIQFYSRFSTIHNSF